MKDNPMYSFCKKELRNYQKFIALHGSHTKKTLTKYVPSPFNKTFLEKMLHKQADSIGRETRSFLVEVIDEIVEQTITFYNNRHKGDKLTTRQMDELKLTILKEFLLSKFKDKTLDQRVSHSVKRLKGNLSKYLQQSITEATQGSKGNVSNIINSITGKDYQDGGTAFRWNSRLVLSEMFRAYQYTAKKVLMALEVEEVEWINSPRHEPKDSVIDQYAEKTYKPENIPEYPYPCNDSYIKPIYN